MNIQTYKNQDLKSLWSSKAYDKYQYAQWNKLYYPFNFWNDKSNGQFFKTDTHRDNERTILEIGSAMGRGYEFLRSSMAIQPKNFTGIDITNTGINYCKENYPEANWIQSDFSSYEFTKKYDFSYERHSIHHMPEPMEQFKKILDNTNCAFCSTFRGCIEPGTVSDLRLGRFSISDSGIFFLNIISVPDLIALAIDSGFNRIKVVYRGLHETISSKQLNQNESGWFLDEAVAREKTLIYSQLFAARASDPKISVEVCYSQGLRGIKLRLIQAREFRRLSKAISLINNRIVLTRLIPS